MKPFFYSENYILVPMSDHNQKALYFCHTHPNLFLQKKCEGCKRGMCHTCIYNNLNYCSDCLRTQKRFSSNTKDKKELFNTLIFAVVISCVIVLLLFHKTNINPHYPLTKYVLIAFVISLSASNCYYLFQKTTLLSDVNKIPFIGFKLSILIIVLVVASGLPILYLIYKSALLLKTHYFNRS